MKFETQFDHEESLASASGEPIIPVYKAVINNDHVIEVVQDGEKDQYAYIQSFAESCKLENVVKMYTPDDISNYVYNQDAYYDLTKYPKDIFDAIKMYQNADNEFKSLKPEQQQLFDNNTSKFLEEMISGKGIEKLNQSLNVYEKEALNKQNEPIE